jgi:hypothetical protein
LLLGTALLLQDALSTLASVVGARCGGRRTIAVAFAAGRRTAGGALLSGFVRRGGRLRLCGELVLRTAGGVVGGTGFSLRWRPKRVGAGHCVLFTVGGDGGDRGQVPDARGSTGGRGAELVNPLWAFAGGLPAELDDPVADPLGVRGRGGCQRPVTGRGRGGRRVRASPGTYENIRATMGSSWRVK